MSAALMFAGLAASVAAGKTPDTTGDKTESAKITTTSTTTTTTTTTTTIVSTPPETARSTASNDLESPDLGEGWRLSQTDGAVAEWRSGTAHSGTGAFRFVGSDLRISTGTGEAALMYWRPHDEQAGTGLRQVVTGWYRFTSFPAAGRDPVWIMATVPTDGVVGADNKPVVIVTPTGVLGITGSNGGTRRDITTALRLGVWYEVVLHAANGENATQRLVVRDPAGAVVGDVSISMTVSGTYVNRITKWGFGTRQDASGVEYLLDDVSLMNFGPTPAAPTVKGEVAGSDGT